MVKYILIMFVFGTFLMADDSQQCTKPTPTITINDDDSDKLTEKEEVVKEIKVVVEVGTD